VNNNIVLLGDSIIDNTLYVKKYDVEHHVRTLLESDAIVNDSVDGVTTSEVLDFAIKGGHSTDTTHFFISVGGNNLLDKKHVLLDQGTKDKLKTLLIKQEIYSEWDSDMLPMLKGKYFSGYMTEIESIAVILNYRYPKAEVVFLGLYEGNPSWKIDWKPVAHLLPELIATHNEKLQDTVKRLNNRGINASYIDITNTLKPEDYFNDIEPNDSGGLLIAEKIAQHLKE
jgi:hypothetical protein